MTIIFFLQSQDRHTDLMYKKREAENRFLDRKNKILSDQVEELKEKNEALSKRLKVIFCHYYNLSVLKSITSVLSAYCIHTIGSSA